MTTKISTNKKNNKKKVKKKIGGKKTSKSYNLQSKEMNKPIKLKCEVDNYDKFYLFSVTVNSGRITTYLGLDWAFDKRAQMLVCERCSTIKWIKNKKNLKEI